MCMDGNVDANSIVELVTMIQTSKVLRSVVDKKKKKKKKIYILLCYHLSSPFSIHPCRCQPRLNFSAWMDGWMDGKLTPTSPC